MSIDILKPGMLSLLQDSGRHGHHRLGLTNGGPLDPDALHWANRLCGNPSGITAIETTLGGLQLRANVCTRIAITGAEAAITLNDQPAPQWQTLRLQAGDTLAIGYARRGCRLYLAVSGGFQVTPQFGSTATVVREGIGGLNGGPLERGDQLPCAEDQSRERWLLPESYRPRYSRHITLRLLPGYQHSLFSDEAKQHFFRSTFLVSEQCDRMGYRLQGPAIACPTPTMLSEGIALGAVQIPADGQPIVLLNDRQTIGGYPKIGSVLSVDLGLLAQLRPGDKVNFAAVTPALTQRILTLHRDRLQSTPLQTLSD